MNTYSQRKINEWQGKNARNRTVHRSNYPAGPSAGKGILRIYEGLLKQAIKGKKCFRAFVYGTTPETRNLVLKYGGELTIMDISEKMIKKSNSLIVCKKNGPKGKILVGNWLDNDLPNNQFDVILGDGVSNNVPFKDQNKFFQNTRKLLKPGGYFIDREAVINPQRKRQTVEEINWDFIKGKIHWFDVFYNLYFYSDLSIKCRDPKKESWNSGILWEEILQAYKGGRMSAKTFRALWWFHGAIIHCFLPRPEFEKIFKRYFHLKPVKQATDHIFTKDSFLFFFGKVKNIKI